MVSFGLHSGEGLKTKEVPWFCRRHERKISLTRAKGRRSTRVKAGEEEEYSWFVILRGAECRRQSKLNALGVKLNSILNDSYSSSIDNAPHCIWHSFGDSDTALSGTSFYKCKDSFAVIVSSHDMVTDGQKQKDRQTDGQTDRDRNKRWIAGQPEKARKPWKTMSSGGMKS